MIEKTIKEIVIRKNRLINIHNLHLSFSSELRSIFFIMLAALATFDSIYIVLALFETFRRYFALSNPILYAVCYFTYPVQNVVLCVTTFIPVVLAIERYFAVR